MMSIKKTVPAKRIGFMTVLLLAGFGLAGGATPATAASFDCKKATQPLDKRICADAELSQLDETLAGSYAHTKQGLSPEGQKILQASQREWLSYSRLICKTRLDPKVAKLVEESAED